MVPTAHRLCVPLGTSVRKCCSCQSSVLLFLRSEIQRTIQLRQISFQPSFLNAFEFQRFQNLPVLVFISIHSETLRLSTNKKTKWNPPFQMSHFFFFSFFQTTSFSIPFPDGSWSAVKFLMFQFLNVSFFFSAVKLGERKINRSMKWDAVNSTNRLNNHFLSPFPGHNKMRRRALILNMLDSSVRQSINESLIYWLDRHTCSERRWHSD